MASSTLDLELAKPITLKCGLTLPNRLAKAAMAENQGDSDGLAPDSLLAVYERWAESGWGMILTGNIQVDSQYLGSPHDVYVDTLLPESSTLAGFKKYAQAAKKTTSPSTTPPPAIIVQINHPGRQTPVGAGKRSPLSKSVAPSALPMTMGPGLLAKAITSLFFGTPRALTIPEIEDIVVRFARAARMCAEAGFHGIEVHAAHGYLLAQFLSPKSNIRTDAYGGSAAGRAKIVVDIIRAVREATKGYEGFAVGIKFNSVDHQSAGDLAECVEQLRLIVEAGVDFMEVSGGSYEDPQMAYGPGGSPGEGEGEKGAGKEEEEVKSARTQAREAFFLEFAAAIREEFRDTPLMVTGGFRSRIGMEAALKSGNLDLVGIGRPAVLNPDLPKNVVFNPEIKDEDATLYARKIAAPGWLKYLGMNFVGAGFEIKWYGAQMKEMIKA